ncbi:unnamed protein product [Citrullus colocynthis]|uniref:Uncharacterized protein n=1 Tax=Citrullus colocynthis TaxID=252529 RepID=A0ABP0YKF8_9ROSI
MKGEEEVRGVAPSVTVKRKGQYPARQFGTALGMRMQKIIQGCGEVLTLSLAHRWSDLVMHRWSEMEGGAGHTSLARVDDRGKEEIVARVTKLRWRRQKSC